MFMFGVKSKSHICSCFFFSSRRRHTRYWRDWSSDVCSSDLIEYAIVLFGLLAALAIGLYALKLNVVRVEVGREQAQAGRGQAIVPTMDGDSENLSVGIAQAGRGQAIAPTMDEQALLPSGGIVGAMACPRPASIDNE